MLAIQSCGPLNCLQPQPSMRRFFFAAVAARAPAPARARAHVVATIVVTAPHRVVAAPAPARRHVTVVVAAAAAAAAVAVALLTTATTAVDRTPDPTRPIRRSTCLGSLTSDVCSYVAPRLGAGRRAPRRGVTIGVIGDRDRDLAAPLGEDEQGPLGYGPAQLRWSKGAHKHYRSFCRYRGSRRKSRCRARLPSRPILRRSD